MKKNKTTEMHIYELLGIKKFKKMVFLFRDALVKILLFPLMFIMSKEEINKMIYSTPSNYNFGVIKDLEDVKKFKKQLYLNAGIHIYALLICIPNFLKIIAGTMALAPAIINIMCIFINLYCIMLQRYNCIRINKFVEKMAPRYEKQKEKLKEQLKETDDLLPKHTYKITDKKDKESNVTIEQLIDGANMEQLKQYRKYLTNISNYSDFSNYFFYDPSLSMKKQKVLKIEFARNK